MRKALYLQYSIGLAFYYGVSIIGYWAYGSSVSEYLPKELSGPKWAKIFINATIFVQSIISQHVRFHYKTVINIAFLLEVTVRFLKRKGRRKDIVTEADVEENRNGI